MDSPVFSKRMGACMRGRVKKAFTLIELLVVIAIIALLLSIISPALNKVKESARSVICLSNLKQLGVSFEMYVMNNDQSFPAGWNSGKMWMIDLLSYYNGGDDIRLCPSTRKFLHETINTGGENSIYVAWGVHGHPDLWDGDVPAWSQKGMYGSYGINGWVHNPTDNGVSGTYNISTTDRDKYWRKQTKVVTPSKVPLMSDAMWDGTTPEPGDLPPDEFSSLEELSISSVPYDIWVYMMPRHKERVQMLLVDMSVEKVGLRQLWNYDWHRQWEYRDIDWPDWINSFSE